MAKEYEKIDGGRYGIYREKKTDWGSILGGIFMVVVVLAIIGAIAG